MLVVVGSLTGEYLSFKGLLGNGWWWFGTQGWEYMELGRLWALLLIAGMGIWLFIVARGLRGALKAESDRGGLTHLLLYSATAIPVFYCFSLFVDRSSHITMAVNGLSRNLVERAADVMLKERRTADHRAARNPHEPAAAAQHGAVRRGRGDDHAGDAGVLPDAEDAGRPRRLHGGKDPQRLGFNHELYPSWQG